MNSSDSFMWVYPKGMTHLCGFILKELFAYVRFILKDLLIDVGLY